MQPQRHRGKSGKGILPSVGVAIFHSRFEDLGVLRAGWKR